MLSKPPGISDRLYTTIMSMSAAGLRNMLSRAGIAFGDCVEKRDLQERLLLAVERGQGLTSTSSSSSSATAAGGGSSSATKTTPDKHSVFGSPAGPSSGTDAAHQAKAAGGSAGKRPAAGGTSPPTTFAFTAAAASAAPSGAGPHAGSHHATATDATTAAPATSPRTVARDNVPSALDPTAGLSTDLPADEAASAAASAAAGVTRSKPTSPAELKNWIPATTPDGLTYYYHRVTRAVRWERPEADVARKVEERLKEHSAAVAKRQAERLAALAENEDKAKRDADKRTRVEAEIDSRIRLWSRGKDVVQMLTSLSVILRGREVPDSITLSASTGLPEDVKKAYMRALRIVHPDKVATASLEDQLEAQKVFTALSDAYKKYTAGPEPGIDSRYGSTASTSAYGRTSATDTSASGAAARARAAFSAMNAARTAARQAEATFASRSSVPSASHFRSSYVGASAAPGRASMPYTSFSSFYTSSAPYTSAAGAGSSSTGTAAGASAYMGSRASSSADAAGAGGAYKSSSSTASSRV